MSKQSVLMFLGEFLNESIREESPQEELYEFLAQGLMLFDELEGMCRSTADTVFAKKVFFLMEKLKELTDGNEFLDVNGDYTTSLEQAMPDLCTPPDMTDNLSTEDTWSTEDTGNDEESEHVQTPEPDFGDSMQELDDLCEVEKEIKAFWEKRNEFWENRSLDSANTDEDIQQLQQLHRLVSRKRELVAAMKANRLANKQEWFRRMFGLDRNPTNEEINTETQNRLGEPYNGDEGQLHRLVDARIRDQFKDHPVFDNCAEFCERWDQSSFDPDYPTETLDMFEPMVREVFGRKAYSPEIIREGFVSSLTGNE